MSRFLVLFILAVAGVFASHDIVYLTYGGNPSTSIDIHWQDVKSEGNMKVFYKKKGEYYCHEAESKSLAVPKYGVSYSHAKLSNLEEDTVYEFKIGNDEEIYSFKTIPSALKGEVCFAVGGDAYGKLGLFQKMNAQIVKQNPRFIVIGGDIAYARGYYTGLLPANPLERWNTFFREYFKTMRSPEGYLIPMVPIVGNHDASRADHAFYDAIFAIPSGFSFQTVNLGDYLTLICLDTGHISLIEGIQTEWLSDILAVKKKVPYLFAAYHMAAYPSYYPCDGEIPVKIRRNWVPLFDEGGLQVAFEHHNHMYKRTYRLKGGEIDDTGVLYLGDGAWGVKPRRSKTCPDRWYLAESSSLNHFFLVRVRPDLCEIDAIGIDGELIDEPQIILPR